MMLHGVIVVSVRCHPFHDAFGDRRGTGDRIAANLRLPLMASRPLTNEPLQAPCTHVRSTSPPNTFPA